jgi:hypothetical protein
LNRVVRVSTAKALLITLPLPPFMEVPPMIVEAMTSSWGFRPFSPMLGTATPALRANSTPPTAASPEEMTKERMA